MPAKAEDIAKPSVDLYIVASLALWAGDFDFCEEKLKEFAPISKFGKMPPEVKDQEELIQYIGALRQRQISQKKGEYSKLAKAAATPGHELSGTGVVLATSHLHGVVWRLSSREFQMLAYMVDLSSERRVFQKAKALIAKYGEEPEEPTPEEPELVSKHEPAFGFSGSWIVSGNPFVQVQISDMGQIQANATWTSERLPRDFAPIETAFRKVLLSLDEGE